MRYRLRLDIDVARDRVIKQFLDPRNLPKWQPGLVSLEPIEGGETRQVGARSRQTHKIGARETEIIETVTAHNFPEAFSATYEAEKVWNLLESRFIDAGEGKTVWILDSEFKCSGFSRLMGFLMPGVYKRQTLNFMTQFKAFVEQSAE